MQHRMAIGIAAAIFFSAVAITPAAAGFLDRLFSGFVRHAPAELNRDVTEPLSHMLDSVRPQAPREDGVQIPQGDSGPRMAFCVRTCDGHFFPVHAHAGMSAAQMCSSFCPASETQIYSGGNIDHAVGADGKPYAQLKTAFVYRKRLVDGCTCNGHNAFGLASISINGDPTLRPGDMVATETGLVTVGGKDARGNQFMPMAARQNPARTTTGSGGTQ